MVILGIPKHIKAYMCVDSDGCKRLHELGFQPVYRWMGKIYFTKTNEIVEVIKNCNLKTK